MATEDITFAIMALTDQPLEDATRVSGICNAAGRCLAKPSGDVVLGNRAPEHVCRIFSVRPAFEAGKKALDARAVTIDPVALLDSPYERASSLAPICLVRAERALALRLRRPIESEEIRILRVEVPGKTFVGLSGDRRKGKTRAEARTPRDCWRWAPISNQCR